MAARGIIATEGEIRKWRREREREEAQQAGGASGETGVASGERAVVPENANDSVTATPTEK